MELDKIIEAMKDKDIDGAVIDAVKGIDQTSEVDRLTKELESEQGKAKGILEDKKKFKDERDALKKQLDEIETSKLPEDEKRQKELNDLKAKLEEAEAQRQADADKFAKTQRENKLLEIGGQIKWAKSTPSKTANLIVKNALAEIEDLSESTKVEEVLKSITEDHKAFIAADAPVGSGDKNTSGGGAGGDDAPATMKDIIGEAWKQ